MMNDFYNKIRALESFDIVKETIEIIHENQTYLTQLLISQLQVGKDGKNRQVTVFGRADYRPYTIQHKKYFGTGLGAVTSYITNYMSGAFYTSLFVKTQGTTFTIESSVPYFGEIIKQSGRVIMELNQENLDTFSRNIVKPELQLRLSKRLNGL